MTHEEIPLIVHDLHRMGWDAAFDASFEPHRSAALPGRVAVHHRGAYELYTEAGPVWAEPGGRLLHDGMTPTVGDWVAYTPNPDGPAIVRALLPRRTVIERKAAGTKTEGQALAANVDVVLIAEALVREPNARRIERALVLAWESGARPVVVLTKADTCDDPLARAAALGPVADGVAIITTSGVTGKGVDALAAHLGAGVTAVLIGPSGAGKSTLVNRLYGSDVQDVNATRRDHRGRHTTVRRELISLPSGGLLVDTPGIREIGLWDADTGLDAVFGDVDAALGALATRCRFNDCAHDREPGCAVRQALADGSLDAARWQSYRKLQRELAHVARRRDHLAMSEERKRWKSITKQAKSRARENGW